MNSNLEIASLIVKESCLTFGPGQISNSSKDAKLETKVRKPNKNSHMNHMMCSRCLIQIYASLSYSAKHAKVMLQ